MKLRIALLLLLAATPAVARAEDVATEKPAASEHRIIAPEDIKWVPAPPSLPKGAKMAVLHGDPMKPGLFAMRVLIPAGYAVMPHWHPADENMTVISGEMIMGLGEKWDEHKGHTLKAGSVSIMPAGVRHYAWSTLGAVIQIHAMGPWGINYVDPADDPRGQAPAAK